MEKRDLWTSRLELRPPRLDDVDSITAACQDPAVRRWVPIPWPYDRDHAVGYVRDYSDGGWATGRTLTWAIFHGAEFAGVVGLDRIEGRRAEIGFWIALEARGRGVITEAAAEVVAFGLLPEPSGGLGLQRIEWHAYAGNRSSARVAQKLGFRFEGVRRLGALGRHGREDDWEAAILDSDDRSPAPWSILA